MITRFAQPSVNGRRSIFTGSLPATQAAVASVSAAALPQVTMPHSAPVSSAMRRLGALHQLVHADELARCLRDRRAHLRQHQAAAMRGADGGAVDERPHAERQIRIGVPHGGVVHPAIFLLPNFLRPICGFADQAPSCGAAPIYLYWCTISSGGKAGLCCTWKMLTMRLLRSPFASNEIIPCNVSSLVDWMAS